MMAKIAAVIMFALATSAAHAATIWDVEYFLRGDISQATKFYGDGVYELLWTPNYTTVYVHDVNWIFLGFYGEIVLPDGFPVIVFPSGYDQALAVPIAQPDPMPGPIFGVPEPSTLRLMVLALTMVVLWLRVGAKRHQREGLGK